MDNIKLGYFEDFPQIADEDIHSNKIRQSARNLEVINEAIAEWLVRKEEEEIKIRDLLKHNSDHEGRISYECGIYNIRITTGWNWSFDKKEYEIMKSHIPQCFNPVKQKIEYKLDKEILNDMENYSSGSEREMLDKIFHKKQKKMNVIVENKKR